MPIIADCSSPYYASHEAFSWQQTCTALEHVQRCKICVKGNAGSETVKGNAGSETVEDAMEVALWWRQNGGHGGMNPGRQAQAALALLHSMLNSAAVLSSWMLQPAVQNRMRLRYMTNSLRISSCPQNTGTGRRSRSSWSSLREIVVLTLTDTSLTADR